MRVNSEVAARGMLDHKLNKYSVWTIEKTNEGWKNVQTTSPTRRKVAYLALGKWGGGGGYCLYSPEE